jgi:PKHD-type hydroxylase
MQLQVFRVLEPGDAQQVVKELSSWTFVDGKSTASGIAAQVKHNLQGERTEGLPTSLDERILAALRANPALRAFAYPKLLALPHFSRYEPGMRYGTHIDGAVMGGGVGTPPFRCDLAMTLFLVPPDSYEGGELVIEESLGEQEIKLDAGEAVVYSANSLHRVASVTRGVRLAAVTWIQSSVRDERVREILYDLQRAMSAAAPNVDTSTQLLLAKCHQNLLRLVVEP